METRSSLWILIFVSWSVTNGVGNVRMGRMNKPHSRMKKGGMPQSYMNGSMWGRTNSNMNGGYAMNGMSGMMKMYGMEMMDPEMMKYLQPNTIGRDRKYDDLRHNDCHLCVRNCTEHPEQHLCYWQFTLEQYSAMGPACGNCTFGNQTDCKQRQCISCDGIERTVYSINRMIPGPLLRMCKGDRVVIDISNIMLSNAIAIHWHGILQKETPFMDGVPFVTQCPIAPMGGLFRYDFVVDDPGTFFYHAHEGKLESEGIFGGIVVDDPHDPHRALYDKDLCSHVLVINDWVHFLSNSYWPGYWQNTSFIPTQPDNYLINGCGNYRDSVTKTTTPKYEMHVKSGVRYRIRIIAATGDVCLFRFAIEDHTMTLIATDGNPCKPKDFNTLILGAGIRYDVVITSKKKHTSTCSYNIVVKGMQLCETSTYMQTAYLVYDDCNPVPTSKPNFTKIYSTGPYLDNTVLGCGRTGDTCAFELEALEPAEECLLCGTPPDQRFFLHMGTIAYTYDQAFRGKMIPYPQMYVPAGPAGFFADTINNCTSMMPWFPILYQNDPIDKSMICPGRCNNNETFCQCINMIHCEKDSVVELVVLDEMGMLGIDEYHPFHVHGHTWRVCYQGTMEERMASSDFYLKRTHSRYPVKRDMCIVPNGGWATVKFIADNPGYWMFHCHFEDHLMAGMFLLIEVGERSQMKQPPPDFPRCHAYLPKIANLKQYDCQSECHCSNPKCGKTPCSCKPKNKKEKTEIPVRASTRSFAFNPFLENCADYVQNLMKSVS